jgi:hypothetical protein
MTVANVTNNFQLEVDLIWRNRAKVTQESEGTSSPSLVQTGVFPYTYETR